MTIINSFWFSGECFHERFHERSCERSCERSRERSRECSHERSRESSYKNVVLKNVLRKIFPLTLLENVLTCKRSILEKWFPLQGERAHCLKLFCMYDKRFEISKTK